MTDPCCRYHTTAVVLTTIYSPFTEGTSRRVMKTNEGNSLLWGASVAGAPFGSGLLAGGDHYHYDTPTDEMTRRRDQMAAVCKRYGVDLKAAALQFTAFHPAVSSIIPGASRPSRIEDNRALMAETIPVDVWAEFKAQGLLPESAVVPD